MASDRRSAARAPWRPAILVTMLIAFGRRIRVVAALIPVVWRGARRALPRAAMHHYFAQRPVLRLHAFLWSAS